MFISICLVTSDRMRLSKYCIDSIVKTTPREQYELIVVDDHSTDGTVEMLKEMEENKIIDKLVLHSNYRYLGYCNNRAWSLVDKKSEWSLTLSNDLFAMDSWFENFIKVTNDLDLDYIFCVLIKFLIRKRDSLRKEVVTKSGGVYLKPIGRERGETGAGLAVKNKVIKKYNIKLLETPFRKGYVGPMPNISRRLCRMKLKGTRLGKPCILAQDPEYSNPEFSEYYSRTFGTRGILGRWNFYKKHGIRRNKKEYYKGSDYLEGKES
jgi:glycosyltransferase involved in cell wall biosynthesis